MHYPKESHVDFQFKFSQQLILEDLGKHKRQLLKRKVICDPMTHSLVYPLHRLMRWIS